MTERLGQERREMLKRAALELASQHGIEGATIKKIAEKCGVTVGLIYHHFKNKEELILEVFRDNSFHSVLKKMINEIEQLPVEEGIARVASAYIKTLRERGPVVSVLVGESGRNPAIAKFFTQIVQQSSQILQGYLERKILSGEIAPFNSRLAIQMLFGHLFTAYMHKELFKMEHLPPIDEAFIQESVRLFFSGWRHNTKS